MCIEYIQQMQAEKKFYCCCGAEIECLNPPYKESVFCSQKTTKCSECENDHTICGIDCIACWIHHYDCEYEFDYPKGGYCEVRSNMDTSTIELVVDHLRSRHTANLAAIKLKDRARERTYQHKCQKEWEAQKLKN